MPVVALVGNPNSGKSSLFNALTGVRQKIGNYPGVTVDIKSGHLQIEGLEDVTLVDMPGLYNLYPSSEDGRVVVRALLNQEHAHYPDIVLYVVDVAQIEAQMLLLTQVSDLGFPTALVVNMIDTPGFKIDYKALSERLSMPVIAVSSRTMENVNAIKEIIPTLMGKPVLRTPFFTPADGGSQSYREYLSKDHQQKNGTGSKASLALQMEETLHRSSTIRQILAGSIQSIGGNDFSGKLDRVLTHWLFGPVIFIAIMLLIFQAIFAWAVYPMDWIESVFSWTGTMIHQWMGDGFVASFLADGLLAGLSGVLVFVPQIAILFFLISLLEESGYMARAVFLFDRFLQRFGMSGRSIVALISGGACAIPAIMSARTIQNPRERLITILVTPFIACSARIPVFTVLIAFVVPYERIWGIFNSQGLMFAGLYLLSAITALSAGWILKLVLKTQDASFLVLELPRYRKPDWTNVWIEVRTKAGAFIREAGKVIIVISIVLWFLASFGMPGAMQEAEQLAMTEAAAEQWSEEETDHHIAAHRLEASFAGTLGKFIEPVIRPLGFDWKIGIALITSFAAREVFVGSMATIYSVGSDADEFRLREFLSEVKDPVTGEKVFTFATALSLILFYLFALQCMSTLAVVRKETGTWKWPLIQLVGMGGLAYLVSFLVYQAVS